MFIKRVIAVIVLFFVAYPAISDDEKESLASQVAIKNAGAWKPVLRNALQKKLLCRGLKRLITILVVLKNTARRSITLTMITMKWKKRSLWRRVKFPLSNIRPGSKVKC
jgi:hypothetical protein